MTLLDWTDWRFVLCVLVVFCIGRLLFERWLEKDIRRTKVRRKAALPKFKDVYEECAYLSPLAPAQRRQYYRDKAGVDYMKGGRYASRGRTR